MSQTAHATAPDQPEIHHPSREEWDTAVRAALDALGITYDELQRQARERDFQSAEALSVWVMIGDSRI
jgi:hypothetical protein